MTLDFRREETMTKDAAACSSFSTEFSEPKCIICGREIDRSLADWVKLTEKGCQTVNSVSKQIKTAVHAEPGDLVHKSCRISYTHKRTIQAKKSEVQATISPRKRRNPSVNDPKCLFCDKGEKRLSKDRGQLIPVKTKTKFQQTVLETCQSRDDSWSCKVRGRIEFMQDCRAKDAVYHNVCYTNFRSGSQIPQIFRDDEPARKKSCTGRPEDQIRLQAFYQVTQYLESLDAVQVTVKDLVEKMQTVLKDSDCEAYSPKYMKIRLIEHYGDSILFSQSNKKADVVSLKRTADSILRDFYREAKNSDPVAEKLRLIKAAACLIRNDIASLPVSRDTYPDTESIRNHLDFVPDSLQHFLQQVTKKNDSVKLSAIGQAIIQTSRPNTVIAPLQIALGVQMHRSFSSRFLVDTLHHLGFSSSYYEVRNFELNAAQSCGIDLPVTADTDNVQFVCDNVDHNSVTLDGRNTFHGMGIMATVTPGVKATRRIPRKDVSMKDIKAIGQIGIHFYRSDWNGLSTLTYRQIPAMSDNDETFNLDLLWKISWPLKSPYTAWSGMMQLVHDGEHPGKSSFVFLPMIDLKSTDMTCIYSTLKFVCCQAFKNKVDPVVTFDQPLYNKALGIISSEDVDDDLKNIVLRLGTFHMQMSYMGCIGFLMAGSGLQETLELPFAPDAVVHILGGKAYARAVRAHLLTDAALNALLIAEAFQVPQILLQQQTEEDRQDESEQVVSTEASLAELLQIEPESIEAGELLEEDLGDNSLNTAQKLLEGLLEGNMSAEEVASHEVFTLISSKLQQHKDELSNKRTAALWLQYLKMIDILRKSIKAERTGNFKLHLESVQDMLPFLAACGHHNYTKSGWLYLQQMLELHNTHPKVHEFFSRGHHVIRRTDRFWGGLSTDLAIEQVLMRSLKTNGGLTRGSGFGEEERLVWLLCMPACAEIVDAMQSVTDVASCSSEQHIQHKDLSSTRQERDQKDIQLILRHLLHRNPFEGNAALRSISSGKVADASVNADQAEQIGKQILSSMIGKSVSDVTFKKTDQAVTLAVKAKSSKLAEDIVHVDPILLFQRLVKVAEDTPDFLEQAFTFELSSVPTALFDAEGLPRQAVKASLADYIWTTTKQASAELPTDVYYVIDGGFLLHLLTWCRGSTYSQVAQSYTDFVIRMFGKGTVVFDGYGSGPSTKDAAHLRRAARGNVTCDIVFDGDMLVSEPKEKILGNPNNKQRFINLLSSSLSDHGFDTVHATADTDCLIIRTALDLARTRHVVVIGEDTDLIILLLHHATPQHSVFFKSARSSTTKSPIKIWDISAVKESFGGETCKRILFVHAFGGCDTVSSIYSLGKSLLLKKSLESAVFQKQADVFNRSECRKQKVIEAGEKAFVALYGGKEDDSLNRLRYVKYMQKVGKSTVSLLPCKLPPTSAAAKFHSMRTYFQVQEWMNLEQEDFHLSPTRWGWEIVQGTMLPLLTDIAAAPEDLLNVVRCNCKADCHSARCSCRKHGLLCTAACGECRGESCANSLSRMEYVGDDELSDNEDVV